MGQFLSSFGVSVPDIEAKIYRIRPHPSDDLYSELAHHENVLEERTDGKAHRLRHPETGDWYVAVFGYVHLPDDVNAGDGVTLELAADHEMDFSNRSDVEAVKQAIRDAVSATITEMGYWEHHESGRFYEPEPTTAVDGYHAYHGYETRVDKGTSEFLLSIDPTTKFIHEKSLFELIQQSSPNRVQEEWSGKYVHFERPEPQSVIFDSISTDHTVNDETLHVNGVDKSIIDYVNDEYGSDYSGKISPEEPVVRFRYTGGTRTYSTAPSLLRPTPPDLTDRMRDVATHTPAERWRRVDELVESIDHLKLGTIRVDVSADPLREDTGRLDYPRLVFGEGDVLELGRNNAADDQNRNVDRGSWEFAVGDYLRAFGPVKPLMDSPDLALFYSDATEGTAGEAFDAVSSYLEEFAEISIDESPGSVSYSSKSDLRQWQDEFADDYDGALAYLESGGDDVYYDLVNSLNGKAVQHLRHDTFQQAKRQGLDENDTILNTAMGLATKLGVRSHFLADGLTTDAVIGFSVAGEEKQTLAAVLIDGSTGAVVAQTESRETATGTGAPELLSQKVIGDLLARASDSPRVQDLSSVTFHRNGNLANEELSGIQEAIEELQAESTLPSDLNWSVIEISDNSPHRIYNDTSGRVCKTGAYAKLNSREIAITPYGYPDNHQGTPRTYHCNLRWSEGEYVDIGNVGRDVFHLSFLNWWSPKRRSKEPISTYFPRQMHDLFQHCHTITHLPC